VVDEVLERGQRHRAQVDRHDGANAGEEALHLANLTREAICSMLERAIVLVKLRWNL
jgi:hypothetical protein